MESRSEQRVMSVIPHSSVVSGGCLRYERSEHPCSLLLRVSSDHEAGHRGLHFRAPPRTHDM